MRSLRLRYSVIGILVLGAAVIFGHLVHQRLSLERFRNAMTRHNYGRAQELWKKGVSAPKSDPYAELMRILDRLGAARDIRVKDWIFGTLPPNNGTNRYSTQLDIESTNARFGVILTWEGNRWVLMRDYPEIPSCVRQSVNQ